MFCPFGIFCGHFGIFFPFWYVVPRKIWQPWLGYLHVGRLFHKLISSPWRDASLLSQQAHKLRLSFITNCWTIYLNLGTDSCLSSSVNLTLAPIFRERFFADNLTLQLADPISKGNHDHQNLKLRLALIIYCFLRG
jgi:hypothetical protein